MDVFKSYMGELKQAESVQHYIDEACMTVFLWRGHYPVNIPLPWYTRSRGDEETGNHGMQAARLNCKLPLHSMVAFIGGIFLAEDLNLLPAYFFFSITWLFLATSENSRRHPSPWRRPKSIMSMYQSLITGHIGPAEIKANQRKKEIFTYESKLEADIEFGRPSRTKEKNADEMMAEQLAKEEEDLRRSDRIANIATKKGTAISVLAPLKPVLLPVQLALGRVCVLLRVSKSLVNWEASYYAFLVLNCSFLIGFGLLFVPWGHIIQWSVRVFVWVFLGPWMKIVDVCYFRRLEKTENRQQRKLTTQSIALLTQRRAAQVNNERAMKLRDMKCYLFGKFIIEVPRFKEYRYRDIPLSRSYAQPFEESAEVPRDQIIGIQKGQYLDGDIIPIWGKKPKDFKRPRTSITRRINAAAKARERAPAKQIKEAARQRSYSDGEHTPLLSSSRHRTDYRKEEFKTTSAQGHVEV